MYDLKFYRISFFSLLIFLTAWSDAFAQPGCPNIVCGPNQSVDCNVNCVDLTATVLETGTTETYTVSSVPYAPPAPFTGGTAQFINTDDIWGDVINLPFNFCFYGNQYNQVVIGANGLITFDVSLATQFCAWSYTASCPTPGPPPGGLYNNSIMGAYHDIDPSMGGDISYFIQGSAPCRMFVVSFHDVPHYDCDCSFFSSCKKTTQQIVIYETTNVIEVYIQQKELCSSWNNGNATIGIQDATGSTGVTPPGRNTGAWTASNEGWRFTPSGTPNYVVTWYDGNTVVGNGLTVNVCPSATTTYDAEVVYTNCDGATVTVTDQVTVTQNSTVSVSVSPANTDVCSATPTTLTASSPNSGMSYTWSPATGLSATTGTTVDATPTTTTTYTVTGSDGTCSASANAIINVVQVSATTSSTDASCAGDDGTATVTPSGGVTPYTYSWSTNPPQSTQTATGLAAGNYDVTVTDATGCTHTETVTVNLTLGSLSPPDVTATDAICTSDNGTATATPIDGTAPFAYQWDDAAAQTTQTAVGLAAGTYNVTITDAGGCQSSNSVVVGIDPGDLAVSISNSTDVLCNGSCDGTATATTQGGTAPYLFVWDDPANQQTAQATNLCAGTYNVGVADANGCLATDQVIIGEPTAIIPSAVMDAQSNCGNPDGQATASATGGTVAVDYSYSWNSTPVQTSATATGLTPATYTVTVTDDNGCTASTDVDVTSTPGFTASISSFTDAICFSNCDGEATVQANAGNTPPLTYAWNTVPVQASATATSLCAGNYDVTITDALGCMATTSVTIGQPVKLTATVNASASPICIGESSDLTSVLIGGTAPYGQFSWTASPTDPTLVGSQQNPTVSPIISTTYTFSGADANGCTSTPVDVTVEVLDPLTLTIERPLFSPDTGICPYDFAVIDLSATGGDENYSYYLQPDLTTPLSLPMQVEPGTTTTYDFVVNDGCTTPPASASSTITVFQLPQVDFTAEPPNGCDELTTNFTDQTTPTPVAWNWNFGDPNSNSNTSAVQDPIHKFSGPGLYSISLSVESTDGCVNDSTKTDYVEVYPLPQADFDLNPETTDVMNAEVTFTDQSNGNIATWNWSFGTGDTSMAQNPVYTYEDTGTYTVTLLVVTDHGCEDNTSRRVIIEPYYTFYVPNAFSPNSDGKNDYFRGYGEGVDWNTYQMSIFDRWGEEIFYTNDIDNPWNGWFKNKQVPNDVYVWSITIYDLKGEMHTFRGRVTVMR
ncbi:MAG: T9SS type B sorting domain-containing protein [Flavobacteriales bacterium]|nr:T9SS type B sorting domain-containing protein [Flavobacteriales bacterium]